MHLVSTPQSPGAEEDIFYPTSDGRPVGETPAHLRNILALVDILDARYAAEPLVYVAGNMFLYYVKGDRWKHVSPDVFFVRGVRKDKPRRAYYLWEEVKGPDLVIEVTSESTREEDIDDKKSIYHRILGVREYILFDPFAEYLDPPLQGFRLEAGGYVDIAPVEGRVPSEVLGLHFERFNEDLRLFDPATGRWVPTARESLAETAAQRDHVMNENRRLAEQLAELRLQLEQRGS